MNKQLTKKTIVIAASAALIASLALSGSAFADPGNGAANGKKGSIELFSICYLEGQNLRVETDITNTSSNPADLELTGITVRAVEKEKGNWQPDNWMYIGDPDQYPDEGDPADPTDDKELPPFVDGVAHVTSTFELCDGDSQDGPVSLYARSVNAEITVMITDSHKEFGFLARCSDDPDSLEDEVALLNIGNQKKVGAFCSP